MPKDKIQRALKLLNLHHEVFYKVEPLARETEHPVPVDTRAWSQILVSILTAKRGLAREKGTDLADGSDIKGAITWEAIDTPRFNGVIKAGTKAVKAGRIESLDETPHIFLVLWDNAPGTNNPRCRIWCVRPQFDKLFRGMCKKWYHQRAIGSIKSNNFQLHPPRNKNSNVIRNNCGTFEYPLLFHAERIGNRYQLILHDSTVLDSGLCKQVITSQIDYKH
jgi:hypothetical protein